MLLEPKDLLEKLEFDKVLRLLEEECLGALGRAAALRLLPDNQSGLIALRLREVTEMKDAMEVNERLPLSGYEDISDDLEKLKVVDYVLPIEGIQRIHGQLIIIGELFTYFQGSRKTTYASLHDTIGELSYDEALVKAIDRVIDESGEVRPDASPELARIRKQRQNKSRELDKVFRGLIQDYRNRGWLTDSGESIRNGRRVLSVPAEHKRKIGGIIHDESATGQTAFIEPDPVIEINNQIFNLDTEEKKEIYRILRDLCRELRPFIPLLRRYQGALVRLDLIQAKARLGMKLNGIAPKLRDEVHFGIWQARHPLLYLKNKQSGRATIPFDLTLLYDNRILVVSGPNAGGKSVFMKAVGLLQLMVQSGMLIPARADSEMGVFNRLFADIGDQQSLEDDLSTYSSRLANMRTFLEKADAHSLVLIDEFGSGTDPKTGGAIAEAILKELNETGVYGIITTHYSNLKIFAFKNKGIVNGAMHFDRDTLSPTFELKVGRPGSSYAFEIAQKTGLPARVMKYARHRAGKNERAVDELLVDLQREKQEVEEKLAQINDQQKKLDRLIRNYEDLHRDLEFRRKKQKLEAKEQALQETARENRQMEKLIREIRESRNLEKAKALAAEVRKEREGLQKEVGDLKEKVYYEPTEKKKKKTIREGDFVKLRSGGNSGQVESIAKNKAIVLMGDLRMTIALRDLVHANEPLEVQSTSSVRTDTVSASSNFESRIDLRGLRLGEAVKVLEDFVDQALISSANNLRIIHGKGDGVLRKAVRRKLQEYKAISRVYHPEQEQGGDGVTIVEMK